MQVDAVPDDEGPGSSHIDSATPAAGPARELDSAEIFQGSREVLIKHNGEIYRLRLTKNDRLILHK